MPKIELDGLTIRCATDFATIALSSLTDEPLSGSANILLTTVGRADNTDIAFDKEHTRVEDFGRGPVLIEVIQAVIALKTDRPNMRVWGGNGRRLPRGNAAGRTCGRRADLHDRRLDVSFDVLPDLSPIAFHDLGRGEGFKMSSMESDDPSETLRRIVRCFFAGKLPIGHPNTSGIR